MNLDGSLARQSQDQDRESSSPLHSVERTSEGSRYLGHLARITSDFVYNSRMTAAMVRDEIVKLKKDHAMKTFEGQERRLKACEHLFEGIEAQDLSNEIHEVLWQEVLRSRPTTDPRGLKRPDQLTRQEVATEFKAFPLADELIAEEEKALAAYRKFLEVNKGRIVPLDSAIKLEPMDVEILVIDLEVRKAERILDPKARQTALTKLNERLLQITDTLKSNPGKRFEVMELYMLRRLIQAADTGHIASVRHGTPREDLKRERAIDLSITAAGQLIQLQVKNFDPDPADSVREVQEKSIAKARRNLEGSNTCLGVLSTDAVKKAFLLTQEERARAGETTLHEKKAAFRPFFEKMDPARSSVLTSVLGLSPERLAKQQGAFEERERVRAEQKRQLEEERARAPEEAERKRVLQSDFDALMAATLARQEAEDRATKERLERALEIDLKAKEEARLRAQAESARQAAKLAEVDARLEAQRKAQEEQAAADARSASALKGVATRMMNKLDATRWPPTPSDIRGLVKLPVLVRLGFLTAEQARDTVNTQPIFEAKKMATPFFEDPKLFKKAFLTKAEFEDPTPEVLERIGKLKEMNSR